MTGLDDNNQTHPAFERVLNNGTLPPKAGDILVAKGPADGEFHTALIQAVRGSSITIFQANVASVHEVTELPLGSTWDACGLTVVGCHCARWLAVFLLTVGIGRHRSVRVTAPSALF